MKKRKAFEEIEIIRHRAMNNRSVLNVSIPDHGLITKIYTVDEEDND